MSALASGWVVHLAHAAWQSTLAATVVLPLVRLMPRTTPRFRYALTTIALLKFLLPPMLPLPFGIFSAAIPVARIAWVGRLASGRLAIAIMVVHMAGMLVAALVVARSAWRLRMLRRGALPAALAGRVEAMARTIGVRRVPDVILAAGLRSPLAFGILHPAIALPFDLPQHLQPGEVDAVLAHELMHLRRKDVLAAWLTALLEIIWWFNPIFHMLEREARGLREECCDDAVIATGASDRLGYGRTLLAAVSFSGNAAETVAVGVGTAGSLVARIRRLADPTLVLRSRPRAVEVLVATILALLLLPGLRLNSTNHIAFDHATRSALGLH